MKKYQVFISSTIKDLEEERIAAIKTLLEIECIPVGMEVVPSAPDKSWKVISKLIDNCDYMITIVGAQCGTLFKNKKISWTEKEYDYAKKIGIKPIAFIKDKQNINIPDYEDDPEKKKIFEKFVDKLSKQFCKKWCSIDQLGREIIASLTKAKNDDPRPGWIKADSRLFDSSNSTDSEEIKNLFEVLYKKKINILLEIKQQEGQDQIVSESTESFSYSELLEIINDLCYENHKNLPLRLKSIIEQKISLNKKKLHESFSIKDNLSKIVQDVITYLRSQDVLLLEVKDEDIVKDINQNTMFHGTPNIQKIQGVITAYSVTQKGCKLVTYMNE